MSDVWSRKLAVASWVTFASARGGAGLRPTQWFFTWTPPSQAVSPPKLPGHFEAVSEADGYGLESCQGRPFVVFFSPCPFDVRQHIPQPKDNCISIYIYIHSCVCIYIYIHAWSCIIHTQYIYIYTSLCSPMQASRLLRCDAGHKQHPSPTHSAAAKP